ncbi:hypothetical protein Pmar_PMAR003593 [Perkinsus marinus ATCC 50983]|uniref:Uncharacterized protein n=1 Tax=Perkinsus marinus (strain ATCC 50983 / TXsc) TaxID=423536 RepID=C5KHR8_PERM5|nr:hypothetical protein Pmar_PMAR003593 [Perkinsus marinus ATCC 50983]EER16130.1 hypothetical protein Pmar_PMAR003593 [Perkinsus marinus ATCC 50983]|eukprot:XP_002784334.1 hypothetical protein Pmar_PMAR003593 [Perkinsus marinus ATCC 50983]
MVDAKFIDGKIRIGYGRKSGYGGYSGAIAEHPGVRVFDLSLSEDHTTFVWETSMSYENGTEITQEMDDILVDPGNFQASEYCSGMRKSFVETLEL